MIFRRMIVNRKIKQKFCRVRDGNTEQKINIEREKPDCFQLSINVVFFFFNEIHMR